MVTISNRQKLMRLNKSGIKKLVEFLHQLSYDNIEKNKAIRYDNIDIVFTNDDEISEIHESSMGISGTTDVITLPYEPIPSCPTCAELIVNVQMAQRLGNRKGWSAQDELALYIAHGIDHLAGNDDQTAKQYSSMRRRELSWLKKCRQEDLISQISPNVSHSETKGE